MLGLEMVNRTFVCEECGDKEIWCLTGKVDIRCPNCRCKMVEVKKSKKKKI